MKVFKRIFCIILSLILIIGTAVTAFALPPAPTDENGNPLPYTPLQTIEITPSEGEWKYEDYFIEYLNSQYENETFEYYYEEVYEHFYADNNTATADFVLVECYKDYVGAEGEYSVTLGEFEIKRYYEYYPYKLGYFVFVPEEEKIYTLEEAVDAKISGIYQAVDKIDHDLYNDFYEYCQLTEPVIPGSENVVYCDEIASEKDAYIFTGNASWAEPYEQAVERTIGDWKVEINCTHLPYDLGVYVYYKAKNYTLEEAMEKGIVTDIYCINNVSGIRVENTALTEKCKNHYLNYLNYIPTSKDTVYCKTLGKIGNHTVFTAYIKRTDEHQCPVQGKQIIGGYSFTSEFYEENEDNPIGLYVLTSKGDVMSALQAYKSGLVSDEELASVANGTPYNKYDPNGKYLYDEIVVPKLQELVPANEGEILSYAELYKHYPEESTSTPDYVLFYTPSPMAYAMPVAHIIGDYFLEDSMGGIPLTYGYGIYIPETDEIHDLTEADDLGLEDVDNIFKYVFYNCRIGDTNGDNELNIKDATYLQKCLAGLEEYREDDDLTSYFFESKTKVYISDYNRDGVRNIKDATAIQKRLAKITE